MPCNISLHHFATSPSLLLTPSVSNLSHFLKCLAPLALLSLHRFHVCLTTWCSLIFLSLDLSLKSIFSSSSTELSDSNSSGEGRTPSTHSYTPSQITNSETPQTFLNDSQQPLLPPIKRNLCKRRHCRQGRQERKSCTASQ